MCTCGSSHYVSVDLDSAATISDHDTTGLFEHRFVYNLWFECSAVCCSNEMDAYQPKQKAIFQQSSKKWKVFYMFVVRKIFMDYVVPDKKEGVLFVLPILSQT